jgi:ParB-like chromosome segregation protein Spo0J
MAPQRDRKLVVETISIGSLRLDPQNPRQHSARQIGQIARSIESFGFNVPVLVDRDNKVLAGHGRVQALQRLGRSEAPVIRLEHLTPAQAKAFNIADNRLTETASWNDRLLGEVLQELSIQKLDFQYRGDWIFGGRDRPSDRGVIWQHDEKRARSHRR